MGRSRLAQPFGSIEPAEKPLASLWQPDLDDEDIARWGCAHGDLLDSDFQPYHFGGRPLFKIHGTLSAQVVTVKVLVLPFYDNKDISGLRLCLADATEVAIGYIPSDKEISLSIGGTLRGTKVATEERGVHGLSLVDKPGIQSATAGVVTGFKIKKLGLGNPVTDVKAYFGVSSSQSISHTYYLRRHKD
ncbi:uncharacterized protein K460DRAFT_403834 [Cucurbitaria berberidis CBS 394.84]|uniref:DUF7600 domain-containing protein n=1 Tax=Cucurbitaria berberidis CBS 394.84 TaxID=1168544 RepID=A0A9P4GNK0_9PLEO|nr:uncharacterized protein K460DRAFT_403834 [Cucurbitaria berberidis CBS 394.84]KAF1848551.1 hypothetical protein K460DRAFT_403834 [Cucurbitaria berberidis CBS 394.84]